MLFQIKTYLQYLWNSKNEHGIHSPFVFNLITKCFYNQNKKREYIVFKKNKKLSLNNLKYSNKSCFFQILNQFILAINPISRKTTTNKKTELLYKVVSYFNPNCILEVGKPLELFFFTFSMGVSKKKIIYLKDFFERKSIFHIEQLSINNNKIDNNKYIDFMFFNRNIKINDVFNDFLTFCSNDVILIFDAIHSSKDSEINWKAVKNHSRVTVTIDCYYFGFVFFRKEQRKQHFVIRV